MKIALVWADNSKLIKIGGKHVHQNLLEKALKQLGHEVETFYPIPFGHLNTKDKLKAVIETVVSSPIKTLDSSFRVFKYKTVMQYYWRFFENLDVRDFDVVHAHDVVAAGAVVANKLVLTIHGYLAKEALNYSDIKDERAKRKIYEYLVKIEKHGVARAEHIIAVDTRIKNYVVNELGYPAEKVTVIYNAVDTDRFVPVTEEEKRKIRKTLGLPTEKLIVFVPRRYVDKNGVHYAARAFSKMNDMDFFFIFAGDGPLKGLVEEILKGKENAMVLGPIANDHVHRYYQASDVILVPSITTEEGVEEATSLTMLEGMACGKIVVCTKVGGMKEVIKDGENGFLIDQKSEDAIVEKLLFIKNNMNQLEELKKNARHCAEKHGYIEHAKTVLQIYKKVLDKQ